MLRLLSKLAGLGAILTLSGDLAYHCCAPLGKKLQFNSQKASFCAAFFGDYVALLLFTEINASFHKLVALCEGRSVQGPWASRVPHGASALLSGQLPGQFSPPLTPMPNAHPLQVLCRAGKRDSETHLRTKEMNKQFTLEENQMTTKHLERYPTTVKI